MKIKLGEWVLDINEIEHEEYKYSNLYERDLHNFDFLIQVKGNSFDKFQKILEDSRDGEVYKLDENGEIAGEYKIYNKSYTYRGNNIDENKVYNYTLHFEEVVRLKLESLKIGDLEVIPYEYEEYYDDALIIDAKIKLTKEEMEQFKAIEDWDRYFNVIRNGISDRVVTMRFGINIWSENEGTFKVSIVLVEDIYDTKENKFKNVNQIQMKNMMNMLATQRNINNQLIALLLEKGLVSELEIEDIKSKAERDIKNAYRLFYKVKDIDKL